MSEPHFFDFAAEAGITKHLGGIEATDKLIQHCQIKRDNHILDVGCGVGHTATYIAKKIGAKVTGIDINLKMIQRSIERAKQKNLTQLTEFKVANAEDIPFPDNTFDAVITESVTAFPPNKQRAVDEYARVTRKGGYVGLNESTWLMTPPPKDVMEWVYLEVGSKVNPKTPDEWKTLLGNAGLTIEIVEVNEIVIQEEAKKIISRYGYWGMAKSLLRALKMYISNQDYRRFVKKVQNRGITPPNLEEYFGYGLYVARKNN